MKVSKSSTGGPGRRKTLARQTVLDHILREAVEGLHERGAEIDRAVEGLKFAVRTGIWRMRPENSRVSSSKIQVAHETK